MMKCFVSMLLVLGLLSPVYAETVIVSEDFEGAVPGTLLNTLSGWSGPDEFVISATTIDQGQSLDCGVGSTAWPRISKSFSYTPVAGEIYELSGTLWVGNVSDDYAHVQLSVSGGARLWIGYGYNEIVCQYDLEGGTTSGANLPMPLVEGGVPATIDFKLVIAGNSFDAYGRLNGETEWTYYATVGDGIDMAEFNQVDFYGHGGYAGKIDSISLIATSPVPEPSTVMLCLAGLSTLFVVRRRISQN